MTKKRSVRKKRNNRARQNRIALAARAEQENTKQPHCLVLTRGPVSLELRKLSMDFQKIMEPNVAARLKSTRKNCIKDFVAVASDLSLTHIVSFTQTSRAAYMKIGRIPQGPTVTFKINSFSRTKNVLATLAKQYTNRQQFYNSPCFMTNILPNEGDLHLQVTARMLLDMFPNIAPSQANTKKIRRSCLVHYDAETATFDLRHYSITTKVKAVCTGVQKLMTRKIPDLGQFVDVSDFMTKAGAASDSEAEDDVKARVDITYTSKGIPLKSAIRLTELGPRFTMQIYKIEGGLFTGQVLYHSFIVKTPEEKLAQEEAQKAKKKLKAKRIRDQEMHVEEKKKKKELHKKRCLAGMAVPGRDDETKADDEFSASDPEAAPAFDQEEEDDDDAEYYRAEVGEEPDPDFFNKRTSDNDGNRPKKKKKVDFWNKDTGKKNEKKDNNRGPNKTFNKKNNKNDSKDDDRNGSKKFNHIKDKRNKKMDLTKRRARAKM